MRLQLCGCSSSRSWRHRTSHGAGVDDPLLGESLLAEELIRSVKGASYGKVGSKRPWSTMLDRHTSEFDLGRGAETGMSAATKRAGKLLVTDR
jgi:hypothetical protein